MEPDSNSNSNVTSIPRESKFFHFEISKVFNVSTDSIDVTNDKELLLYHYKTSRFEVWSSLFLIVLTIIAFYLNQRSNSQTYLLTCLTFGISVSHVMVTVSVNNLILRKTNIFSEIDIVKRYNLKLALILFVSVPLSVYYEDATLVNILLQYTVRSAMIVISLINFGVQDLVHLKISRLLTRFIDPVRTLHNYETGEVARCRPTTEKIAEMILLAPEIRIIRSYFRIDLLANLVLTLSFLVLCFGYADQFTVKAKSIAFLSLIMLITAAKSSANIVYFNRKILTINAQINLQTELEVRLWTWTPRREFYYASAGSLAVALVKFLIIGTLHGPLKTL